MPTNNSWNSQDPVQVTKGGTGLNTVAQGDLLIASASNTLASLPKDTNATRYLSNTGTNNAPAYAQVDLSNGVTGTLPVGNGGTGVATTTAYGVLAGGTTSTGAIQNIGAGTSGQILKSNGSSSLPTFVAPSSVGGSMVLLGTIDFNNTASTYDLTSYFSSTYKTYKLLFTAIETPSGVDPDIRLRVSTDGGATFKTTGYKGYHVYFYAPGSAGTSVTTHIVIGVVNGVAGQLSDSETLITGYGTNKGITTRCTFMTSQTDVVYNIGAGYYPSATINGIQIYNGNGNNYISGQLSIYGIVQ